MIESSELSLIGSKSLAKLLSDKYSDIWQTILKMPGNDYETLASLLMSDLGENDEEIKASLMSIGLNKVLRDHRYQSRLGIKNDSSEAESTNGMCKKINDAVNNHIKSILDEWVFDDGTSLGDATCGQLRHYAKLEESRAWGHQLTRSFYKKVAGSFPDHKIVREVRTNEEVEKFKRDIFSKAKIA